MLDKNVKKWFGPDLQNTTQSNRLGSNSTVQVLQRAGQKIASFKLLHQTGRTRRRRNSFTCQVVKDWNRLPHAVASVPEQHALKKLLGARIIVLFIIFGPIWSFWSICPFSIIKYIHHSESSIQLFCILWKYNQAFKADVLLA